MGRTGRRSLEPSLRNYDDIARFYLHVGGQIAALEQVVNSEAVLLLVVIQASRKGGAIARREIGRAADLNHHVEQSHR